MQFLLPFFIAVSLSSSVFAEVEFSNESLTIPRNDNTYMTLSLTLNSVPTGDLSEVSSDGVQALVVKSLDVCLESVDNLETAEEETCPNKLLYQGRTGDETSSDDLSSIYYITFTSTNLTKNDNEDAYDLDIVLKIASTDSTDTFTSESNVQIEYDDPEDGEISTTATAVVLTPVNSEPAELQAKAQNRGLVAYWTDATGITYADGASAVPSGVRVYVIPVDGNDQSLNITTTYSTADTPVEQELDGCTLSSTLLGSTSDDNTCSFYCTERAYINSSRIDASSTIQYLETSSSDALSFANLDLTDSDGNNQAYAVIAQYLPDGLLQEDNGTYFASCAIAYPTVNYTYAQLTGASEPKQKNPTCFIATAAYGHPMHHSLDQLRWFRDSVLMQSALGEALVNFYYKHSPSLAREIALNENYKAFTRALLWLPVKAIEIYRDLSSD